MVLRTAIISDCGLFRYRAGRKVGPGRVAALFGVNPARADHEIDDHTVRKLYGFGDRHGIGEWIIGNKCAYRATDVTDLRSAVDAVGPENDRHIEQIMRDADLHIFAWGPLAKLPPYLRRRWLEVVRIGERVGITPMCFTTAKCGQPRHPLMLAYDTPLIPWTRP